MIEIQIIGIRKPGGAYNTHSAITITSGLIRQAKLVSGQGKR